jgi:murein DD-endopeptidase MepM/ murein hydrolase activator NlpD
MLDLKCQAETLLLQHQGDDVRRRLEAIRLQQRLDVPEQNKREAKLREASQDFEAIFLHQLLKQMRSTVPKEGLLHSRDKEFWQSHFDAEMSVLLARAGGIGLGEIIFQQLREHQVKASAASSPPAKDIPVMTLLAPYTARTVKENPSDKTEQTSAPIVVLNDGYEQGQDSRAQTGSVSSAHIPGPWDPMERVRSLARAIEERGGVVPEHPGLAPVEFNTLRDMTASTGLPPMHWPLQARVSSDFGWRRDPFTGERTWHAGVDLAAPIGTPVQAAWDGQVVFAGEQGRSGRMIVLEHAGGWRTYYAHNDEHKAEVGDKVRAGQTIATVGLSGQSTGPHLHFEIRQDNLAWNPEQIRDRLLAGLPIGKNDSV